MTPPLRSAAYAFVAVVSGVYVVAYLVLAVVSPEYSRRMIDAIGPLVAMIGTLSAGLAHANVSAGPNDPSEVAPAGGEPVDETVTPVDGATSVGSGENTTPVPVRRLQ